MTSINGRFWRYVDDSDPAGDSADRINEAADEIERLRAEVARLEADSRQLAILLGYERTEGRP